MSFVDVLPILLIILFVGAAVLYLRSQKKKGRKCIGCPYCDSCSSKRKNECCSSECAKKENNSLHK